MAKKYDNLWGELTSFENLLLAYKKAAKGKRSQPEVADFENNRERYLFELQKRLLNKTYCPAGYSSFHIVDPKPRLVSAAHFMIESFITHFVMLQNLFLSGCLLPIHLRIEKEKAYIRHLTGHSIFYVIKNMFCSVILSNSFLVLITRF